MNTKLNNFMKKRITIVCKNNNSQRNVEDEDVSDEEIATAEEDEKANNGTSQQYAHPSF